MSEHDHYFTAAPASADERRRVGCASPGATVEVEVAPGIFSPGGLDKGTAVLLDEAPAPPATGTFLDLGCGWGPDRAHPGAALPRRDRAGRSTSTSGRSTSPGATPPRWGSTACARAPPTASRTTCASTCIWSNPPIRVGKAALHDLLRTWLPRLAPGGVAHLVVQRNLGSDSLQRWIETELADAVHPADVEQGLPGARGEAAMTATTIPALGVVLVPTLPPEALRPLAAAADRHLDELWLWEDCFKESSIAAAGAALAWTAAGAGRHRPGAGAAAQRRPAGHGARDAAPALPRPPAARHRARRAGLDGAGRAPGPRHR